MKKFLTSEEAIELLPEGEEIHTFYNFPFGLVGADWEREDIIERLNNPNYKIEVCGEAARAMNHGICVYKKGETIQSNILFIETNMDKLNEIDPLPEKKEERATVSEKFVSLDAYKQVRWERDIAIQQLHELGYEIGQKIEPTTKNNFAVDCISRQFMYELGATCIATRNENGELVALGAIEELPSIIPIRPKGHWICDGKGRSFADYHCSECGLKLALCGQDIKQRQDSGYSLFCGGCGADMRGTEE